MLPKSQIPQAYSLCGRAIDAPSTVAPSRSLCTGQAFGFPASTGAGFPAACVAILRARKRFQWQVQLHRMGEYF